MERQKEKYQKAGHKSIFVVVFFLVLMLLAMFVLSPGIKGIFLDHGLKWLYILAFSFFVSFLVTPLVRLSVLRIGVLDNPDTRKIHTDPIPLLGGIAIYVAFTATVANNLDFSDNLKGIIIGATMLMLCGMADDVVGVSAKLKLLVQITASLVMSWFGIKFDFLPNTLMGNIGEVAITAFWVVGITNALNFFDGMDGLAVGITAIMAFFIGLFAIQADGQNHLMLLSLSLMGSCLGFLPYNFRLRGPATIFIGDTGSMLLGFSIAAMAVMGVWGTVIVDGAERNDPVKAFSVPILIMGVLIFDMIYTTVERIVTEKVSNFREWIDYTGKDHLHHRLNALGLSRRQSVLFIYLMCTGLGLSAIALKNGRPIDSLLLIIQAIVVSLAILILMVRGAKNLEEKVERQENKVRL